jgi:acyl-CoA synthetase (AMP-forming)/AMP-acid ligase II
MPYRWIRTGDEVIIDKNNDLFIVDRLKVTPFLLLAIHAKWVLVGNLEGSRLPGRPR